MAEHDEFYVGYLTNAPRGIGVRTRFAVLAAFVVGLLVVTLLLAGQAPFAPSRFEFGVYRDLQGVVIERPYPALLVHRPGEPTATDARLRE